MNDVNLTLNSAGKRAFNIIEGLEQLGTMEVDITGSTLTVYHTEVAAEAEGKGIATSLLSAMVAHARSNNLTVQPLCPFVRAQFDRHPDKYADIWKAGDKD